MQAQSSRVSPLIFLGSVGVALAAAGTAIQFLSELNQLIPLPGWLLITLGVAAIAVKPATDLYQFLELRHNRRRQWEQRINELLRCWSLPPVTEADPYTDLGVFDSTIARKYVDPASGERPPYIPREIDDRLRERLQSDRFILIVGPSKSGKTRTAYEACAAVYPDKQIIVPRSPKGLHDLLNLDPLLPLETQPAVLWLDNLLIEDASLLDPQMLKDQTDGSPRKLVIIATMSDVEHDKLRDAPDEISQQARGVLNLAGDPLRLSGQNTETETREAVKRYERETFTYGIGEHFFAAHELVSKFLNGAGTCPEGFALVCAAIDWRRAGGRQPVNEATLRGLYTQYLKRARPHVDPTDRDYTRAVEWSQEPVKSSAPLLIVRQDRKKRSMQVFDYLSDYVDTHWQEAGLNSMRAVPEETWNYVIENTGDDDALSIGLAAYFRNNTGAATKAFSKAIVSTREPEAPPMIALVLGFLLEEDDPAKARNYYQQAIDSNNVNVSSKAAVMLGLLLQKHGEFSHAKRYYQQAIDSDNADTVAWAANSLGNLLKEKGDLAGALTYYQQVIDSGHAEQAPRAALNLGVLLKEQGDPAAARTYYQQAIDSKHLDAAPMAAVDLGNLLLTQEDLAGAQACYQQAIDSEHPDAAPWAAVFLGLLLHTWGNSSQAGDFYEQAINSDHADAAPLGSYHLGMLLQEQKDLAGARTYFEKAIAFENPDVTPRAMVSLGHLLADQGKWDEATTYYQQAIDSGHVDWTPRAAFYLGVLLEEQESLEEAKVFFQQAIDSGHPEIAPLAAEHLERLRSSEAEAQSS